MLTFSDLHVYPVTEVIVSITIFGVLLMLLLFFLNSLMQSAHTIFYGSENAVN